MTQHQTTHLPRQSEIIGVVWYLIAAFLFALNGALVKPTLVAGLSPDRLTEVRNAGAAIILFFILLTTNRGGLKVKKNEWLFLLAYGVIAFALNQFLYFTTISRLPIGIGTLLAFLAPVVVALWLRFGRKQKTGNRTWVALVLTLVGLACVAQVWQGFTLDGIGLLSGLCLAVTLATYWILGEKGQARRDAISLSFWGFALATLTWAIVRPWWTFPYDQFNVEIAPLGNSFTTPTWTIMIYSVIFGTIVPFLLVLAALKRIGAQRSGIVGTTEPVWAMALGFLLLGEALTPVQLLGSAIVLLAILIVETAHLKKS